MKQTGQFIVLEGIDGAGKSTQFSLLHQKLIELGHTVKTLDFPRYQESEFGRLIARMLQGEFGSIEKISPYFATLPYMIDQALMAEEIKSWLAKGYIVLSNRYFTSNFGHQVGKLSKAKQEEFRSWLIRAGYEELGIVKEDIVLFLDVAPEYSSKLMRTRKERPKDEAEKSARHQERTYIAFKETLKILSHWIPIHCQRDKKLLSPEEVHGAIITVLGLD